jgi:hypothetical protein
MTALRLRIKLVRQFLAWQSIEKDPVGLNLDEFQKSQAEKRRKAAEDSIVQRIPEAYMWLMVPEQPDPRQRMSWSEMKLQGSNSLAGRASRTLINKGLLAPYMNQKKQSGSGVGR